MRSVCKGRLRGVIYREGRKSQQISGMRVFRQSDGSNGVADAMNGLRAAMKQLVFETATNTYTSRGSVGDGGCGTVFRVTDIDGETFALKLLRDTNTNKRKRFKNELAFCRRNQHDRIIRLVDEGVYANGTNHLPFYVMPLFTSTMRKYMQASISHDQVLRVFGDILDGVEAAHLQGVIHRDLKPENLLVSEDKRIVVADFGIAHFREEELFTIVETRAADKLANYRYSAPEQRTPGAVVDQRADIFALGYILNEMFTADVPHGAGYKRIVEIAPSYAYLDPLVEMMIQQSPSNRPRSIGNIKEQLIGRGNEFIAKQRLDAARRSVVSNAVPNDPLGGQDIQVLGIADYADGTVSLRLSAAPPSDWMNAMQTGNFSFSSIMGDSKPQTVQFRGDQALVRATETTAQQTIGHFKDWVGQVNHIYRDRLKRQAAEDQRREAERIRAEIKKAEEEARFAESLRKITF
jgi:serine/threonine protein kinase